MKNRPKVGSANKEALNYNPYEEWFVGFERELREKIELLKNYEESLMPVGALTKFICEVLGE